MLKLGVRWTAAAVAVWLVGGCAVTNKGPAIGTAERVEGMSGVVNLSRDGDVWFAGQPTEAGLSNLKNAGVTRVINLRTEAEMSEKVGFDEAAVARELGMDYVSIPFRGGAVDVEHADQLAKVLSESDDATLLHCGSSNRVGAVWAIYLNKHRAVATEDAIRLGQAAGMTSPALEQRVRNVMDGRNP